MFDLILFLILLIFSFICIYQDVKTRKVSNYVSFSFLALSFLYFLHNVLNLAYFDYVILLVLILLTYYTYKKGIFGAADGKILIGCFFFFTSINGFTSVLTFLVILFVLYSVGILLQSVFSTSLFYKKIFFKAVDYNRILFQSFVILIVSYLLFLSVPVTIQGDLMYVFLFLKILIVGGFLSLSRKLTFKMPEYHKLILTFALFAVSLFLLKSHFFFSFFLIFTLLFLLSYIPMLTTVLRVNKKKYYSPFTAYVFTAVLIAFIYLKTL